MRVLSCIPNTEEVGTGHPWGLLATWLWWFGWEGPTVVGICILGPSWWNNLDRFRRCGLPGGSVLLETGFEAPKAVGYSLFLCSLCFSLEMWVLSSSSHRPACCQSRQRTLFPLEMEAPINPSFHKCMVFCHNYGKVTNTPSCLIGEPRYQREFSENEVHTPRLTPVSALKCMWFHTQGHRCEHTHRCILFHWRLSSGTKIWPHTHTFLNHFQAFLSNLKQNLDESFSDWIDFTLYFPYRPHIFCSALSSSLKLWCSLDHKPRVFYLVPLVLICLASIVKYIYIYIIQMLGLITGWPK